MSDLDLRRLRYLVAVADEGAITAAAERLEMTQPALSRAIRALEAEVGVPLLVRGHRGVEPTEAGRVLLDEAREIDRRVTRAVGRARRVAAGDDRLRVSARGCDVAVVERLTREFEGSTAVVADWRTQTDGLRTGEADLALIRGGFDRRGLDSDVLAVEPRVALLPEGHALAGRDVLDRDDLAGVPVVVWATDQPAEREFWLGFPGSVAGPEVNDMLQLLAVVRLGRAVAFVSSALPVAAQPGVVVVPVNDLSPAELRLAWREDERSPAVARFVRHAAAVLPTG
ncbi:LysR family transcriptional regulator [Actinoplanes sp. LDG1-06]|uniref:LysR family transcriptional regulator n=1 Tax=Paractinoplanes ovalisporus TaxID=2810368 RepID=A0ABS2AEC6_9ACTN|nr:LysR family transcriptional regulator [Actinoplanes ovalisporus]MBM2618192.1 LysR family transcriptional regulator [Actinoplanes ovalisporus]